MPPALTISVRLSPEEERCQSEAAAEACALCDEEPA